MRNNTERSARVAWLVIAGLLAFMAAFAVGCGNDDDSGPSSDMLTELGEPENELNIICWAAYCEDGSLDPAADWITGFEEQTGCQVNVKIGNTSDQMVQLMRSGGYDGVSASGDATTRLIEGGNVDPVNTDLIPNYADVYDSLKDQPFNSVDGQMYGVPHGRGSNLLMYDPEEVTPAPTSWEVVFDGAEEYSGRVTAYDNPIYIADAALYLREHQPDLGITDPYELDQEQFDAAIALLKDQSKHVGEYWSVYSQEVQAFLNGDSSVGTTWQVNTNLVNAEGGPEKAVLPSEGATGWSDTWMISSEAEHPNCMYLWMNHIISPKVNAQVAEYFGEAPGNEKSCQFTSDPQHCEIYHANDEAFFDQIEFWRTPVSDCGDDRGDVCKTYDEWVQGWNEVKG